jgi:hypothetical protein
MTRHKYWIQIWRKLIYRAGKQDRMSNTDNQWRPLIEWLWQEYKTSAHLNMLEGGKGYKKFVDRLDPYYIAGGRLRQHFFMYLRYLWPISPASYIYYKFEMSVVTPFTYAYVLVDHKNLPEYICVSPTYDSRDGEYRNRLITVADFQETYSHAAEALSRIEQKLLALVAEDRLHINISRFPGNSPECPSIEDLRMPIKAATVAVLLDMGGWMQPHVNSGYQRGIEELASTSTTFRTEASAILDAHLKDASAFIAGKPPSDTRVACGSKLSPLTLREVMSPHDITYSAWRELTIRGHVSDLVLNGICPSFAYHNQWTYLGGAKGSLYENPNIQARYRRSSVATESVSQLRSARKTIQPELAESNKAADYDAHIYESIEYAQGFLLMSEEALYSTDENAGFTLAALPAQIATYKNPRPEYTSLVSLLGHFAKLAFDYLYGLHCMHTKIGVIHADLHANNATIYRCGATHVVRQGKTETFEPIVESPLVVFAAGPRGEADTYVFPFTGTVGCVIDFSRSLIGPSGLVYSRSVEENGKTYVRNFLRDQVNRVLRAFYHSAPTFTEKNQEALKAVILANPEAVFRALTYSDFLSIGRSLGEMLGAKVDGIGAKFFAPPAELRAFAKRIENTSRDALVTYMSDLVAANIDPIRIPYAGELLLPKLFAEYKYSAWDVATLRRGDLVDAYNYNNPLKWSGEDYKLFPPWARLDKLEEHMGGIKITEMFPRGIKPFLESIIPTTRFTVISEEVRAEQDTLDAPAGATSSWIESSRNVTETPEILYHGSTARIEDWLEPRPSKVINGEKAVFATPNRWMAEAFASGLKHTQIDLGVANGVGYLAEMYPGAFNILKIPGYLYTLSSEGFKHDPRLMGPQELINPDRTKILKTEMIGSLYDAIAAEADVRLVSAAERVEFFRESGIPEWQE